MVPQLEQFRNCCRPAFLLAPHEGVLLTSAMLPAAINAVNRAITRMLNIAALTLNSPSYGAQPDSLIFVAGRIHMKEQVAGLRGVALSADDVPAIHPPAGSGPFEELINLARLSGTNNHERERSVSQ